VVARREGPNSGCELVGKSRSLISVPKADGRIDRKCRDVLTPGAPVPDQVTDFLHSPCCNCNQVCG